MHGLPNVSQEELKEEQHDVREHDDDDDDDDYPTYLHFFLCKYLTASPQISIGDILKNIYEANYNQVSRFPC